MPHSLYLGSGIVQPRLREYDDQNNSTSFRDADENSLSDELKYRPSLAAIKHCRYNLCASIASFWYLGWNCVHYCWTDGLGRPVELDDETMASSPHNTIHQHHTIYHYRWLCRTRWAKQGLEWQSVRAECDPSFRQRTTYLVHLPSAVYESRCKT